MGEGAEQGLDAVRFRWAAGVACAAAAALAVLGWEFSSFLGQVAWESVAQAAGADLAPAGWSGVLSGFSALTGGPLTFVDVLLSGVALGAILLLARRYRGPSKHHWLIVALSVALSLRYLLWRGLYTLNTADPLSLGLSLAVFAAELYGFGGTLFFYLQVVNPSRRTVPPYDPSRCPSVDVFVTICNEPADILRRTLVACRAMEYPADRKKIYVLDDGSRREIRQLAASLGCVYLSRPARDHAKAGNLNYAMARSTGEIIVTFDTDHVPVRTFLKETIGAFDDPNVAFVQTPHYFSNPDIFQRNLRLEEKLVNEQDLFFRIVQPGRDGRNSMFFTGSGGVFRRRCLEEIGGFATASVTEDIHTSILLHAKGYRSVYVNRILTAGLAPESYSSFLRQRRRWARGAFQIFLSRHNPLLISGLTFIQRVDYFASMYYFLHGPARLIYMVAPLAYLLFGQYVIAADPWTLLTFYATAYIGTLVTFSVITRGFCNPFWADVYETVMSFYLTMTLIGSVLFTGSSVFHVTPKGTRFSRPTFHLLPSLPYIGLACALGIGIVAGVVELVRWGYADSAVVVSLLWGSYNFVVCATAALVARERPQRRESPRLLREMSCEIHANGAAMPARVFDLSETGVRVFLDPPRGLPPAVDVRFVDELGETTVVSGRVVRNDRVGRQQSFVGIEFRDVSDGQRQGLIRRMYCEPSGWATRPPADTSAGRSLLWLGTAVFRAFEEDRSFRRLAPRSPLEVPCEVVSRDAVSAGVTEDVSETGLLIRLRERVGALPDVCAVRLIPGSDVLTLRGRIVWKTVWNGTTYLGVRLEEPLSRFLITWIEFAQKSAPRVPGHEAVSAG
ncbi:MAG: glycosyltransferase [Nitrospirae bacterium]|nr:glycosyltransferase [Nitrospirota bacterium]